jgi:DNA-binding response OmpR family regulator
MGKKVLIVEDHPPTVRLIRNALEAKGLSIVSARNGAECLIAIDEEKPDLVILDVIMPIMDGFQTLRVLRENEKSKTLPVIILSIRKEDADILKGLSIGADLYLTKPFNLEDLVVAVERVLQGESEH